MSKHLTHKTETGKGYKCEKMNCGFQMFTHKYKGFSSAGYGQPNAPCKTRPFTPTPQKGVRVHESSLFYSKQQQQQQYKRSNGSGTSRKTQQLN